MQKNTINSNDKNVKKWESNTAITDNKVIHYCWFGGKPLSKLTKKCIASWKKYLPDFKIIQWDEENVDINACAFIKGAYEQKKWAYVADYTRFKVLEKYGGLYLDTDMEITADISKYLKDDFFVGKEDSNMTNAAVVWAKNKEDKHIKEILKIYESFDKFNPTGDIYTISVPRILSKYFKNYGFDMKNDDIQILDNGTVHIYPMEYFYPLSYDHQNNKFTKNSCMIHHFDATWTSNYEKVTLFCRRHNLNLLVKIINSLCSIKVKFKNISDNKNILLYFFIMTIIFFGIFIKLEYATDTYTIFSENYKIPFNHFLTSGRFITAIFWYIVSVLNLSIYKSYIISFLIGILCITFSQYKLYNILKKKISNDVINKLISTLIILNAFSIELFLFYEKGILALSILFIVTSIQYLIKVFEGQKKYLIHSLIFMILANCCYQGTVALFVSLSLVFIVYYYKNIKQFLLNNVYTALIYGTSAFVNYFFVNFIFKNNRTATQGTLLEKILLVKSKLKGPFIDTYGILPKYSFLIFNLILLVNITLVILTKKINKKQKLGYILGMIYIIVGTIFAALVPQLMVGKDYIWLVPRSTYAIASLPGLLILYMYLLCYNYIGKCNIKIEKIIICLIGVYLFLQFSGFLRISIDHYVLNYKDREITYKISDIINEYQKNTGIKVKNIAIYKDNNHRYSYKYLKTYGDINVSGYSNDWSIIGTIYTYSNIKLNQVEADNEIYENYFKGKDWQYFDSNQVLIKGNTLNLCIY